MKRVISLVSALIFSLAFGDAKADSTKIKQNSPKKCDLKGFYIGAGVGTFKAAKKFKAVELSYDEGTPKGNPAVMPNLAVGYRFNEYFRTDLNWQYRRFKYSVNSYDTDGNPESRKQKIKNNSIFLNTYFDVPKITLNSTRFRPYVTFGVGYSYVNPSSFVYENSVWPGLMNFQAKGKSTGLLVWNTGLGCMIKITSNWNIDLMYRYSDLGKVKINQAQIGSGTDAVIIPAASQNLRVNEGTIGLIYKF